MQLSDQLRALEAAQGEPGALARAAVDLAYPTLPEGQRQVLKDDLDAAAIPHWFDEIILTAVLDVSQDDASARLERLRTLRTVERFPARGETALNVHEAARLALRRRLSEIAPDRFRNLSANACRCFAHDPSPAGRIEWVFHLLSADPERGASELEALNRGWSASARPEDLDALAAALKELERSGLVQGRARAWILLVIAWTRVNRGESAQLRDVANEVLQLAQAAGDLSAQADAQLLLGDVLQAQGQLAVAHGRVGEVPQAQGQLAAAQAARQAEGQNQTATDPATEWQEWQAAGQRWLKATREGIRQLADAFNAPPTLGMGYRPIQREAKPGGRDTPEADLSPTIAIDWVPVDLRAEKYKEGVYRLLLKHLREGPETAPVVTLHIDESQVKLGEVDYRKPILHLLFRADIEPETAICKLAIGVTGEGPITVRLTSEGD